MQLREFYSQYHPTPSCLQHDKSQQTYCKMQACQKEPRFYRKISLFDVTAHSVESSRRRCILLRGDHMLQYIQGPRIHIINPDHDHRRQKIHNWPFVSQTTGIKENTVVGNMQKYEPSTRWKELHTHRTHQSPLSRHIYQKLPRSQWTATGQSESCHSAMNWPIAPLTASDGSGSCKKRFCSAGNTSVTLPPASSCTSGKTSFANDA